MATQRHSVAMPPPRWECQKCLVPPRTLPMGKDSVRILAIETSGPRGGIALACHGEAGPEIVDEISLAEGLRHGRDLVPTLKDACARAGWNPRQLPLIAVSIGPGSFTGIRIAVTLAKFLAWDTGAQVVAVPSFRALAANAPADRTRVVTIVDAKRSGLFASIFERTQQAPGTAGGSLWGEFNEVFGPALIEPAALAGQLSPPAYILGHGIAKGGAALGAMEFAPPDLWDIRPSTVARLGLELAAAGRFANPLRLEPLYIRVPEAEEIWNLRHPK
jgi:tRNA threonylcarbamoyladenosine biosynthesis protein TsaB